VVVVGPWPVDYDRFDGTDYAEATVCRLEDLPPPGRAGPLRAGAAAEDITPPVGEPLAGYSGRHPKRSISIADRCFARAVTLSNGHRTVTIVGGDLLAVLPQLRDAILARIDLAREEVYFTATHTHSGPGGYSDRWVDQLVLGEFHEAALRRLADGFARAIRRSRAGMQPAGLYVARREANTSGRRYARNRIDPAAPAYADVFSLVVRGIANGKAEPLALIVVASPHATCRGPRSRLVSADYPGVVQRLARREGFVCMFAAGAVGSTGPEEPTADGAANAEEMGRRIWHCVDRGPESPGAYATKVGITSWLVEVTLPPQQFRISQHLRLSPVLACCLHDRMTYIHALRIGRIALLGMPGDFSGELAAALGAEFAAKPLVPAITSFNGDYIGYLLPRSRYGSPSYEGRTMSLFGPWCGEYAQDVSRRLLKRIMLLEQH
jgi:hypothetical protein